MKVNFDGFRLGLASDLNGLHIAIENGDPEEIRRRYNAVANAIGVLCSMEIPDTMDDFNQLVVSIKKFPQDDQDCFILKEFKEVI